MTNKFKVGDKVVYRGNNAQVVAVIAELDGYAIEFEHYNRHYGDCGGLCVKGHGAYAKESELSPAKRIVNRKVVVENIDDVVTVTYIEDGETKFEATQKGQEFITLFDGLLEFLKSGEQSYVYDEEDDDDFEVTEEDFADLEDDEEEYFKVGDRVRIRSWADMKKEFGENKFGEIKCIAGFLPEMKPLCGMWATIEKINEGGFVKLKDYDLPQYEVAKWTIHTDMLEK